MDEKDRRIEELEGLLAKASERIGELERRLALMSHNSARPQSGDGFRKQPATKSLRDKGQQRSVGGQKGHKGHR